MALIYDGNVSLMETVVLQRSDEIRKAIGATVPPGCG